ncbi:MAG: hypothetical protein IT381_28155 [Deltaproteobacteria bacterium]|nr:hypothetical protein [Deltaproteobacteria bacterium]
MALLSNSVRLSPFPHLGGASVYTAERNVYWSAGQRKTFAYGEARIDNVTNRAAVPEGYVHPYCHSMAQKSGGMASRARVVGDGDVTAGNLAGGLNGEAALTGAGDITNAALGLILSAVASLTGSGTLSADIVGKLEAAADLAASGDITGALGSIASLLSSLTGNGILAASAVAKAFMDADISVTGELLSTANVGDAVFNSICEAGFSYGDAVRIIAAVAAGKTSIEDLGGGNATVTFRDLGDTKNRVEADMTGSERTDVTLDGD